MKKQIISMALSTMLLSTTIFAGTTMNCYAAESMSVDESVKEAVQADMENTASYLFGIIQERISAEGYTFSYNDYVQAMLCLKSGQKNDDTVKLLTENLMKSENTILNPSYNGIKSLSIAAAILFLNETGLDVTDFNGENLMDKLYDTFMAETSPNPYTYQYVNAAYATYDGNAEKEQEVLAVIKEAVMDSFVDGDSGTGIDYWGVSADNNGSVLSAWKSFYGVDEDITSKVDKSIEWTTAQANDTGAIVSWGSANSDSTGLALRLCAEYGKLEAAESLYEGTEQFKSTTTEGAYTVSGRDNTMATVDILWGLVAYDKAIDGHWIFDMVESEEETPGEETPEEETPEETTANATDTVVVDSKVDVDGTAINISIADKKGVLPNNVILSVQNIKKDETVRFYLSELKKNANVSNIEILELTINNGAVSELNGTVEVSIDIPSTIDKTKTLVVYRVDKDGKITALPTTVKDGRVVFETNHFSTYIIAEVAETEKTAETTTVKVESPKTADHSNVVLLFSVLMMAAGCVYVSRKKTDEKTR